jgi:hypothetical protein
MTVRELYAWALQEKCYSTILLIEYLVHEKNVLSLTDTEEKYTYYLQDKFHKKLNEYLADYEIKRNLLIS